MFTAVARVFDLLQRVLLVLVGISVFMLAVLLLLQVLSRYLHTGMPRHWIDEFVRIVLIWGVLLGAAVLVRDRKHMVVDFVAEKLKPANRRRLDSFVDILLIAFFLLVLSSVHTAWAAVGNQVTPSLRLPRTVLLLPFIVSIALSLVYSVESLSRRLLNLDDIAPASDSVADEDGLMDLELDSERALEAFEGKSR